MNVLITGSSGMVGGLILEECVKSDKVGRISNLVRNSNKTIQHQKVDNVVINNFETYDERVELFKDVTTAFFCLGVYTGQVKKELFKKITVDYAVNFARLLAAHSPESRLCLLSGAGADRTEKSRTTFARFKGMAENQIATLALEFYTFRPGYIYPVTPRKEPSVLYAAMRFLYPVIKLLGSNASIRSTELARAMFLTGMKGANSEVLENKAILGLFKKHHHKKLEL